MSWVNVSGSNARGIISQGRQHPECECAGCQPDVMKLSPLGQRAIENSRGCISLSQEQGMCIQGDKGSELTSANCNCQ